MRKITKISRIRSMIKTKLTSPGAHLNCDDLTPNQKLYLWELMKSYGASQGFAYDRFFKEGFREWELLGIDNIKKRFIEEHQKELWTTPEDDGTVGYAGVLATYGDVCNTPGEFYRTLGRVFGLKKQFTEYMKSLGMGTNSVLNHFTNDDWKDYERVGIMAVIDEFESKAVI